MFEEIFQLLSRFGLRGAARALHDLLLDLSGESLSLQQLHQEVCDVLKSHGGMDRAGVILCALVELGYVGPADDEDEPTLDESVALSGPGLSSRTDSLMLLDGPAIVVTKPSAHTLHATAMGWLDIDSGIYVDVSQHDAGHDRKS